MGNQTNPHSDIAVEKPNQGALLKAVEISKSFKIGHPPLRVLDQLNLDLSRKETLAVVGASGIGKSTLLHILGTLDRPDQGSLYFNGDDVFEYNDMQLARFRNQTIGFVFQFHHLLPEFTALENTMMPAIIQGMDKTGARDTAEAILVRIGLAERLHHKATQLSGGEQQRVALARAVALNPPILLADEPTGNLDENNSEQIHQLLAELNQEMAMAIIVVTHNMALASIMQRQATIVDGKLEYQ